MLEINLDQDKFLRFVKSLKLIRFTTLENLKEYFYDETSIRVKLEEGEVNSVTGDFCFSDNCTVNEQDLCQLDLFYVIDNKGYILITDYYYEFL